MNTDFTFFFKVPTFHKIIEKRSEIRLAILFLAMRINERKDEKNADQ